MIQPIRNELPGPRASTITQAPETPVQIALPRRQQGATVCGYLGGDPGEAIYLHIQQTRTAEYD